MLNKKRRIAYRIIDLYHVESRWLTGRDIVDTYEKLLGGKLKVLNDTLYISNNKT
tara:strand:+ start:47 stop:211 length:165 start_codon:yes stop_codon:yes gene_type:complete